FVAQCTRRYVPMRVQHRGHVACFEICGLGVHGPPSLEHRAGVYEIRCDPTSFISDATGASSHRSAMSAVNARNDGRSASDTSDPDSPSKTRWTNDTPSSSLNDAYAKPDGSRAASSSKTFEMRCSFSATRSGF